MDCVEVRLKKKNAFCQLDIVDVKAFQNSWINILSSKTINDNKEKSIKEKIGQSMKITDGRLLESLAYDCNPNTGPNSLDCEIPNLEPITMFTAYVKLDKIIKPDNVNLMTVSLQEKDLEKRIHNQYYRQVSSKYFKENIFDIIGAESDQTQRTTDVFRYEVLLEIQIYRQAKYDGEFFTLSRAHAQCVRNTVSLVSDSVIILGNQYLTSLKDFINCQSDIISTKETSDNPDQCPAPPKAKDVYKSGFFYLDGVFYNDFRDPSNKDYSKTIIEWAKKSTPNMGPYVTKKMEETKFADLQVKLGYPYLYQHQGDCEHIIMINNIRMINEEDSHNSNDYPMPLNRVNHRLRNCMMCTVKLAKWITLNNERVFEDPFDFCDECFRSYNYNKEGKKIGNFKAFSL